MIFPVDRKVLIALLALNVVGFAIPILVGYGTRGWSSEGGATTYPSAIALMVTSWYAYRVYGARRSVAPALRSLDWLRDPAAIWALMSLGFAFLALDDLLRFHELIDRMIHVALGMEETAVTDSLDDLIIGVYLIIGLAVLWRYRHELLRVRRALAPILLAILATVLMIIADSATGRPDFLMSLFDEPTARSLFRSLSIFEEFAKNGGGILFAWTMMRVRRVVESRAALAPETPPMARAPLAGGTR